MYNSLINTKTLRPDKATPQKPNTRLTFLVGCQESLGKAIANMEINRNYAPNVSLDFVDDLSAFSEKESLRQFIRDLDVLHLPWFFSKAEEAEVALRFHEAAAKSNAKELQTDLQKAVEMRLNEIVEKFQKERKALFEMESDIESGRKAILKIIKQILGIVLEGTTSSEVDRFEDGTAVNHGPGWSSTGSSAGKGKSGAGGTTWRIFAARKRLVTNGAVAALRKAYEDSRAKEIDLQLWKYQSDHVRLLEQSLG